MNKKGFLLASLIVVIAAYGCDENATAPVENEIEPLSDAEQTLLISTEISQGNGGMMTDVSMAASTASGTYNAMAKTAGFDTTITSEWITYQLSLQYFTGNGISQDHYVQGVTDSVVYQSTLTGEFSDNLAVLQISLNSGSTLTGGGIKSGKVRVNGTGANNSTYRIKGGVRSLNVQASSFYKINDVIVNLQGNNYIPVSGTMEATIKGTFTKEGGRLEVEENYEFTFQVEFTGNQTVRITLPSGKEFTLNLYTGEHS